ncbi:MAG: hypothetical protein WCS49_00455 [Bacilli bacterium]
MNEQPNAANFNNNQQYVIIKQPKRRRGKGWLVFLIIFLIVVVAPIATFFALFYDTTRNNVNINPDADVGEVFSYSLVDSLANTTDPGDERVELVVTQDDLNQLLYAVTSSLDSRVTAFVPQMDVIIDGNNYDFYVNLQLLSFKTRIILKTTISEDDVNQAFVFTINDIVLGRLVGVGQLSFAILSKYVSDQDIENSFNGYLSMDVSLKDRTITYPQMNLINDIQNLTNSATDESSKLYFSIFAELLEKGILDFNFNGRLQAKLILTQLMTNSYIDGGYNLGLTSVLDNAASETETLIENETIDSTDNSAIKTKFDEIFDANSNIPPSDTPDQIMLDNLVSIDNISDVTNFKNGTDGNNHTLTYITEGELNGYLANCDLVGSSYIVSAYRDNVSTVRYITVDNFYCNFVTTTEGDFIYFAIGLNINGCETSVVFVTKYDSSASSSGTSISMKFVTKQIYYGNVLIFDNDNSSSNSDLTGNLVNALFNMVSTALADINTMSIDEDDYSINIEFTFDTIVQSALTLLNQNVPYGSAVPEFYADSDINSNVGKLKIVWQND